VQSRPATSNSASGALSSYFSVPLAPGKGATQAADVDKEAADELEVYLALPVEKKLDLDVLAWWKARDHCKPADLATGRPEGLPHLAKMARQFLGRPATSAGVERMFSKAGRMHDDMRAAQTDGTLQHALLAAANAL
jgi:hypothetical protein